MSAYERLQDDEPFRHYRVPQAQSEMFLQVQNEVHAIYRRHATQWGLWRMRAPGEEWTEWGPRFREDADRRAAAEAFDARPALMDMLVRFEVEPEMGIRTFIGRSAADEDTSREMIDQETGEVWEVLFEIGVPPDGERQLPHIAPEDMTPAMRLGQSLAAAIASRLAEAVPPTYTVRSEAEMLILENEDGWGPSFSLVDIEPLEGVREVLWGIQDDLTEELTVPWPHDPARGYTEHEASAEVRGGSIHAWYGPSEDPVLVLEPLPLADLDR